MSKIEKPELGKGTPTTPNLDSYVKCDCGSVLFDQRVIIKKVERENQETKEIESGYAFFPAYTCANCGKVKSLQHTE